jgi:WD40 repeat protein
MLTITVKSSGNKGVSETLPGDLTRTNETRSEAEPGPEPEPDLRPVAPTQVRDPHRYEIIAEHGRGGLGLVSRAHDRELDRDVAIKELLSRGHVNELRFMREALITARLEHPGIVPIHEAGRWPDGTPFYAMKLVSGRSLRELIVERTTVPQRLGLLHHVIAVADAIAYAHDRHIIHRDLKPANVIVGEFGETIVIDWGLAKDLTAIERTTVVSGPSRTTPHDDLTAVGTVLGTPAYMAPEQKDGKHVDQRADVYAIGAMLWELCALERAPTEPQLRHRMLRRAGIDKDLATIIDKALDPDPARRYPHAGALAADLKAFKSGARIAARSYSLPALLTHWIRRHRALALSATAALVVAVAGTAVYVRNIAVERDRADSALERVEATKNDLVVEHAELTLKHAQLLLTTDPSAAVDILATYRGADRDRANQLRAEAIGRGVALLRAVPHTDNIVWATGTPDGAVVSLSTDGTISRTSLDRNTIVLARGATPWPVFSYAPSRHLLAYACDPADLCMMDVLQGTRIAISPEFRDAHLVGVAFSPGEDQLALISGTGVLRVFDVRAPAQPVEHLHVNTGDGHDVLFVDEDTIAVGTPAGLKLVRGSSNTQTLLVPDGSLWDASARDHQLAIATTRGQGLLVATDPLRITARETLCQGAVSGLKFIPGQRVVAYACTEGTVGTWDLQSGKLAPRAHIEGHADTLAVSATGDYLLVAGGNGTLTVIDLYTDLVTSYRGHEFRLTAVSPPTAEYPFLLSADVRGGLRVWPLPNRGARVVANLHTRFLSAMFDEKADSIIATTHATELTVFSPSKGVRAVGPHAGKAGFIERARNGSMFAAYGASESIELWSSATMARERILDVHHGAISHLEFVADTGDFLSVDHDGRLVRWTTAGDQKTVARFNQPLTMFAQAHASKTTVVNTADGALWRVDDDGRVLPLKAGGVRVTRMLAFPDGASVCIGYGNGDVIIIDTKSWQQTLLLHAPEAVQDIALTLDGRTIAIAANDNVIRVGARHGDAWNDAGTTWTSLAARARQIALAPDGLLVAACIDGTVWLYSPARKTWLCLPTGTADLTLAVLTTDGEAGAVLDAEGRIIWIDLKAVWKELDGTLEPTLKK